MPPVSAQEEDADGRIHTAVPIDVAGNAYPILVNRRD
jgi:hypothetical protein